MVIHVAEASPRTEPPGLDWFAREGAPLPLGVSPVPDEDAFNVALYSRHATGVTLLLYGEHDLTRPCREVRLEPLRNRSGRIWHCRLSGAELGDARYYGYSVDGPRAPEHGCRFDPDKVLLDPYARMVFFPPGFDRGAAIGRGSNAGRAPLGVLPRRRAFDWGDDRRPRHTSDLIIYEMHVRGFTRRPSSGVSPDRGGTYAGVIEKIPYLKELGVTAVELLPVYLHDDGGYWGYMPLSFFAPHGSYARAATAEDQLDEFREMVKALHRADIEVILDVVYNHTTEQGDGGPTFSYRGIDNSSYYLLTPDLAHYFNDTGTGNVLRTSHPAVRQLVVDSLRYWVKEMHVDGFRFDLASIFTRDDLGRIDPEEPPILSQITSDPDFADIRLIAEPWDLGTYQLGRGFPGRTWHQWNGRFRDDVRSFVKSDPGMVPALMTRLYGSDDLFPELLPEVYRPYQSVNFVTCHDGFCLYDLVAYNHKHNHANGEGNRDGHDDNRSWNCGHEGDVGVPAEVIALRRRQAKNLCSLLLLANGTPMLLAGDEFLHTQRGNNNPYNQDNETTWLDWDRLDEHADVLRFWKRMIAFRKAHPSVARGRFWRDAVRWYGVDDGPDLSFDSRTLAFHLDGSAVGDRDLYVMINAYWEDLTFRIQAGAAGTWKRAVDTGLASPEDIVDPGAEPVVPTDRYRVGGRSVVVLVR